jgi:hypothetical protein
MLAELSQVYLKSNNYHTANTLVFVKGDGEGNEWHLLTKDKINGQQR